MRDNSKLNLALKLVKISLVVDVSKLLCHFSNILFDSFLYHYYIYPNINALERLGSKYGACLASTSAQGVSWENRFLWKKQFYNQPDSSLPETFRETFDHWTVSYNLWGLLIFIYGLVWPFLGVLLTSMDMENFEFHVPTINSIGFTMGCLDGNLSIRLSQTTHWLSTSRFLAW